MKAGLLASWQPSRLQGLLEELGQNGCALLNRLWFFWSHAYQDPPAGDWSLWLLMGGRGAGKTKAGAEWVNGEVYSGRAKSIGVIGETMHDARAVMVEGHSGLLLRGIMRGTKLPRGGTLEVP